jgi:hypothetical protein
MRRRHCILVVLTALLVSVACADPAPAVNQQAASSQDCGLTPEELDVYSATIQELLLKDHDDTARVIIRERTSTGYPPGMASMKSSEENERDVLASASVETRGDFDTRNKSACKLDPHIRPVERIQLLTFLEEQVVFPRGSGSWKAFYKKYPGATGFTILSRIGFNSAHDQALVYLGNSCELLCGRGRLVLLRKHKGNWKIVKQGDIWVAS